MINMKIYDILGNYGLMEEASVAEKTDYMKAENSGSLRPANLVKFNNTIYKKPDNITNDDYLSIIAYATAKSEHHLRFIKNCIIIGVVLSAISVLFCIFS